uniref:Large ribosomal subunit protein mL40 n=1 Tax=Heterorhabditis bacteriophora TaxID=37862 RepID=A0A1I7XJ31_HETBA
MDPEVAKQREIRRRRRLEKEIRQMQKHSKKPKPVDELTLDIKSAKNIKHVYFIYYTFKSTCLNIDYLFIYLNFQ